MVSPFFRLWRLHTCMLDQIIYLLQDAVVGNGYFTELELVDVGDPQRARVLQDQGVGLIVADVKVYADYLSEIRKNGDNCPEFEQFVNRVRSFPLEWRTPEWEALVASLGPRAIPVTVNVTVNEKPKRKRKVADEN